MLWLDRYADLIVNLSVFFTLDLFLNTFAKCKPEQKQRPTRIVFVVIWTIFSVMPTIPYPQFTTRFIDILYVFLLTIGNFRSRFFAYIKFLLYYYIGSIVIAAFHTLITLDAVIFTTNETYAKFATIIGFFLLYVILNMYVILRKLSDFPSGKLYKRYFLAITSVIILLLITCSMLFGSSVLEQQDIAPVIFSLLLIITLLCMSIYRRVITILNENAITKIEAEKNALEQDYYAHVEENLKNLSLLRHDFKNHLLVIQDYATRNDRDELLQYIDSLYEGLSPVALIETPSTILSSLINAKNEDCKTKGITLQFSHNFNHINISDFHLVTIMSNLLDNAITAAAKTEEKEIRLRIEEMNSYLSIDCMNYHNEQIQQRNNIFFTTKPSQKEIHGLGITSMRKAVDTLHGEMEIQYTSNTFHVNILLPNY